jgi:serine/threonine-protein kinase
MNQGNDAARHLLLGLLALQTGLIDQAALVAAFHAWTRDKARPLADHLIALGHLDVAHRPLLEGLAAAHLAHHGGDVERSLAALPAGCSTRESLAHIGDPDIEGTLARVDTGATRQDGDSEPDRTATYSVGTATSEGQRFRVLRPHARGGLGAVFVALDTELHREVALKQILDSHADDPVSRARFLLEAEVTGGLEHPGIVPVYGLGTYADGRPYYAMRFVRGGSLKEAIDRFHADAAAKRDPGRRSLELRRLLRRFTDVCNAIDYAHSRGVLHRDIKPGNVIVGQHGETLIVDWGLAKARGRADATGSSEERPLVPSSASGSAETLPGSALGTPAYMSPEQARGDLEGLGPSSDVYSLGATLFCLLTGRPPVEDEDLGAVLRAVGQGNFPPPRQLDPTIDKALEAVCLKAMARQPEDRYGTPKALASDIERWMADEPVTAWREPLARRARRWAWRNRTAVAVAAVALLVGLVGLGAVTAVQAQANSDLRTANAEIRRANAELAAEKTRVQERFDLAMDAVRIFHTGVSEDLLLKEEQFQDLRNRLLRGAAGFYSRLERLLGGRTDRESRVALGQAYAELGTLTGRIGDTREALSVHRKALAVRRALAADRGADAAASGSLARSLLAVGSAHLALGDKAGATAAYREARGLAEALAAGGHDEAGSIIADAHRESAFVLSNEGKSVEALAEMEKARAIHQARAAARPDDDDTQAALAATEESLGYLFAQLSRLGDAMMAYQAARAVKERLADRRPDDPLRRDALMHILDKMGHLMERMGRSEEALATYEKARGIEETLNRAQPAVPEYQRDLAHMLSHIASLRSSTGRDAEALEAYHAALAIQERLTVEYSERVAYRTGLAGIHQGLAEVLRQAGRAEEGLREDRQAREIYQALADAHPEDLLYRRGLADSLASEALDLLSLDRFTEAAGLYDRAVAMLEDLAGRNSGDPGPRSSLVPAVFQAGMVRLRMGDLRTGEASLRRAVELRERLAADFPADPEHALNLAVAHLDTGQVLARYLPAAAALPWFDRAIASYRSFLAKDPTSRRARTELAHALRSRAETLDGLGRRSPAAAAANEAVAIREALAAEDPGDHSQQLSLASDLDQLARIARRAGRLSEALESSERAVRIGAPRLDAANAHFESFRTGRSVQAFCLTGMAAALQARGRFAEAVQACRRSLEVGSKIGSPTDSELFVTARTHARLASLAAAPGSGLSGADDQAEAGRAMSALQRAMALGMRDLSSLQTCDDLDRLRDRDDFRRLMLDLAMPADPFAP